MQSDTWLCCEQRSLQKNNEVVIIQGGESPLASTGRLTLCTPLLPSDLWWSQKSNHCLSQPMSMIKIKSYFRSCWKLATHAHIHANLIKNVRISDFGAFVLLIRLSRCKCIYNDQVLVASQKQREMCFWSLNMYSFMHPDRAWLVSDDLIRLKLWGCKFCTLGFWVEESF